MHDLLGRGAVVAARGLVDDVLLVAGMLERLAERRRGDRLDAVLEEEAGGLGTQGGDSLARLERTVVVVGDELGLPSPNPKAPSLALVGTFSSSVDLFTNDVVVTSDHGFSEHLPSPELDLAGVLGLALLSALIVVVMNTLADILYGILDPRIRYD